MYSGTVGQDTHDKDEFKRQVEKAIPELTWEFTFSPDATDNAVVALLGGSVFGEGTIPYQNFGPLFGCLRFINIPGKVSAEAVVTDADGDVVEMRSAHAKTLDDLLRTMSLQLFRGAFSVYRVPIDHPARERLMMLGVEPLGSPFPRATPVFVGDANIFPDDSAVEASQSEQDTVNGLPELDLVAVMFRPIITGLEALGAARTPTDFRTAQAKLSRALTETLNQFGPMLAMIIDGAVTEVPGVTMTAEQGQKLVNLVRDAAQYIVDLFGVEYSDKFIERYMERYIRLRQTIRELSEHTAGRPDTMMINNAFNGPGFDIGMAITIILHANIRDMYDTYKAESEANGKSIDVRLPTALLDDELKLAGFEIAKAETPEQAQESAEKDARRIGRLWSAIIMGRKVGSFFSEFKAAFDGPESEDAEDANAN